MKKSLGQQKSKCQKDQKHSNKMPGDPWKKYKIDSNTPQEKIFFLGKACRRSGRCCNMGSGIAREEEIPAMAKFLNMPVEKFKEKYLEKLTRFNTTHWQFRTAKHKDKEGGELPYGPCIFHDDKNKLCMIHEVKPEYCRIGTCSKNGEDLIKWYNLKHFVNTDDPQSIRDYVVWCMLNTPLEGANPEELVPKEILEKVLNYEDLAPERDFKTKSHSKKQK